MTGAETKEAVLRLYILINNNNVPIYDATKCANLLNEQFTGHPNDIDRSGRKPQHLQKSSQLHTSKET